MLKMMLEIFALSFFWKYFLSPASAVMAAILISRYEIGFNNEKQEVYLSATKNFKSIG